MVTEMVKSVAKDIYQSALAILSRREYSAQELRLKLNQKFIDSKEVIEEVIENLIQEGYQSDLRFTTCYIRSRTSKGFGVARIRMEVKAKGITDEEVIESALQEALNPADEIENLPIYRTWKKKFRRAVTREDLLKQRNFLLYRGYLHEEIQTLFDHISSEAYID